MVSTFLVTSVGVYIYLAEDSKRSILDTVQSFTSYDIESFNEKEEEREEETSHV